MTRNKADFQGVTFKYYDSHPNNHEIEAYLPNEEDPVGYMRWSKTDGTIHDINVPKAYRRQGIATAVYNHAVTLANTQGITMPKHSPVRTPDGAAWAASV